MKVFSISFDPRIDDVRIKFTKEFEEENIVIQLDIIKDSLYRLEKIYDRTLDKWGKKYD